MKRAAVGLLAALAVGCAGGAPRPTLSPGTPEPVATWLGAMPTASAADEAELAALLLASGEDTLGLVCSLVGVPGTGNDVLARYALGSVVHAAAAPGNEPARALVEAVLLAQIESNTVIAARVFFAEVLQFVGRDASVATLAPLLLHEDLGSPAARSLTAIGTPLATAALRGSLPELRSPLRAQVILALGRLHDDEAAPAIAADLRDVDPRTRLVAMRALAEIGAPAFADAMVAAAEGLDGYQQMRALTHLLRYAETLHGRGESTRAAAIATGLQASANDGLRHAAQTLLARIGSS